MAVYSCKDCKDRHIRCHSTCTKYIEESTEHRIKAEEYQRYRQDVGTITALNKTVKRRKSGTSFKSPRKPCR